MKYTNNYNLKKPERNDAVDIEDFNSNAEIIDFELAKRALKGELTEGLNLKIDNTKKSDSVTLDSSDSVATSKAVKVAYDKGIEALGKAGRNETQLTDMSIQLENKVDTSKTDIYLYLDTINGNDTNTGLASNISLKSFSKAIKILRKYDSFTQKKIIIVNYVINNVLTTWSIIGIDNLSIEGTGSKKLLKNTCIVLTSCTNITIYNLKLAYTKALLCNGLYLTNLTFYSGTNVDALGPNGVVVYASISATGSKITLNSITIESDLNITDKIPKTLFGGSYTEIFVVSDLIGKADYGFYLFNYDTIIYKQANFAISFVPNISMITKNIGGVLV